MCELHIGGKSTAKSVNKKKKTLIFFKENFRKAQKRGENAPKCPKIEGFPLYLYMYNKKIHQIRQIRIIRVPNDNESGQKLWLQLLPACVLHLIYYYKMCEMGLFYHHLLRCAVVVGHNVDAWLTK